MAPRKTLNDVVEQLKVNNQTTVDIDTGIAGLENQFGKFFTDLKRQKLEDSREAKAAKSVNVAPAVKQAAGGKGGSGSSIFGGVGKLGFLGGLGALAAGIGSAAGAILAGLGPAGVGLGAFFLGLAGAEAIINKFASADAGEGIKKLLINLSEGLSSFSNRSFIALGTVLAAGVLFPKSTVKGLAAVGLGLAAFFTALAGSDKLIQMMNGDGGANLNTLLTNIAGGLDAFSTKSFLALGAAMSAGALLSLFPGGTKAATLGLAAIGIGIGAFITSIAGISKLGAVLGIDGSAFKVLMTNMAAGLNELTALETEGLLTKVGAIGLIGPAVLAAITSFTAAQGVDSLINGAKKVINFITFGAAGLEDQATARKGMIRDLVDAMKPLQEIPSNLGTQLDLLSSGLLKFVKSFNQAANDLDIEKITKTFLELGATLSMTRNLVFAMANGGEFKKPGLLNKIARGLNLGGKIEFGEEGSGGLLDPALKTDDLVKQVQKINFTLGKTNIVPTAGPAITPSSKPVTASSNPSEGGGNVISTNTVNSGNVYNSAGFAINSSGANDPRNMFGTQAHNAAGLF